MRDAVLVLKFGSSVLRSTADFPQVILEIYREVRKGHKVVAVVSAPGDTTDRLLEEARQAWGHPDPRCLARLLETGEAMAAARLGLALEAAGIPGQVLDPVQISLRTSEDYLDAEPLDFAAGTVLGALAHSPVVIVPGFSGRCRSGQPALLGRGGSDLTALFLARGLNAAECRLLKDVDGLLRVNPDGSLDYGTRYAEASYSECLRIGGPLIQPKAVEYAAGGGQSFRISRCGATGGTVAGPLADRFEPVDRPKPLRVALAGLGTVGLGVFRWLHRLAEDFEVCGILVRDKQRDRGESVPVDLLCTEVDRLLATDPDLVIEMIGGTGTAGHLVRRSRNLGIPVITANKQLLAGGLDFLGELADTGAFGNLAGSAAVGGSLPALETVARLAAGQQILALEGIINGTCNFILDRMHAGRDPEEALADARLAGLAEADLYLDVTGLDSAFKLSLLATLAFGQVVPPGQIDCQGLDKVTSRDVEAARARGYRLKLVARAKRTGDRVEARVDLEELPPGHPLADCPRERNSLLISCRDSGRVLVTGTGAGRWPTTVSVLSDALDWRRKLQAARQGTGIRSPRKSA